MSEETKPPTPSLLDFEMPAGLEVEYVNLARIAHSPSEMIFDFAQMLPGLARPRVQSRIVMSPLGAKLFYQALAENITRYEATYGEIRLPGNTSLADQLFRPSTPPS
ncbi:MAG: hypothetical protein ANABAC_2854 [Anaerolineae bacterium]|nr:MAG: hypothetical protein ANABAC_2854 [Anaerolineae bacterium]